MSSVVSFRVNKEIKEEMKKLKHINWSELLRQVVIKKIEEEKIKQQKNYDRIRLAAKRIKERKRYEEYTRLEKKVLELLRQGKISDVKAGAIFEILESAYKLDEPLPDPENLAQKKEEELIKITHKYWRITYWEKKIEKIRPPIF